MRAPTKVDFKESFLELKVRLNPCVLRVTDKATGNSGSNDRAAELCHAGMETIQQSDGIATAPPRMPQR